mgnify:FL=1
MNPDNKIGYAAIIAVAGASNARLFLALLLTQRGEATVANVADKVYTRDLSRRD